MTARRVAPTVAAPAPVPPPVDARAARRAAQTAASDSRDPALISAAFAVPAATADELVRVADGAGVSVAALVAWLRRSPHEVDTSPVSLAIQRVRAGYGGFPRSWLLTPERKFADRAVGGA